MNFKITSLRLKDCGPFDDVLIDFTDGEGKPLDICLVAGPNGSGKTTVLRVIVELFKLLELPHNNIQYNFGDIQGYKELNLLVDGKKLRLYKGIEKENYSELLERASESNSLGYRPQKESIYANRFERGDLVKRICDLIQLEKKKEVAFLDWSKLESKNLSTILFLPHRRFLEKLSNRTQIHQEITNFQLVHEYKSSITFKGSLESYLVWMEYTEPKIFRRIIDFLEETDLDGKTYYINRKGLMVMVKTREGEKHPLSELSAGEQNMMSILISIRRRLDRSGIILIDEVDNSLHPAYQIKLMNALTKLCKSTNSQLIITSHSIDVFDHVTEYNPISNGDQNILKKDGLRKDVKLLNLQKEVVA